MSSKSQKTYSISFFIITILVVFSLAGTASMLFLSKKYSESALHQLADDIIRRTLKDSAEDVNTLIQPAVSAVAEMESALPEGAVISDDPGVNDTIIRNLIGEIEGMRSLYSVYYANTAGEFFLVGKRQRFENEKRKYYFHKKITVRDGERQVTESWYKDYELMDTETLTNDGYDPTVRPWYKAAQHENGPIWTSPYIFYITKIPGLTFAKPIYLDGVFAGVVAADLEINTISDAMKESNFTMHTNIFAIDAEDNILAHSEFSGKYSRMPKLRDTIPKSDNFDDMVMHALKAKTSVSGNYGVISDLNVGGEHYKGVMQPFSFSGLQFVLGIYTPASDYLGPLYAKYKTLIFVSAGMLVVVVVISRYVSLKLAKPFRELSSATESAKELDFDKNINIITGFSEVYSTQRNFNMMLESLRNYQSANEMLSETLHNAHIDTLYRLALAAEHKDHYTYDHLKRVSDISVMIAEAIGMNRHDVEQVRHSSAMHDVGKLGIPDDILNKPGKLTVDEFEIIKTHSALGAKILETPSSEEMENARIIARSHHERWDGSGYPDNLAGENIPLYGRIVALADVIDALLSRRPYKEPYSFERTIKIISSERGRHFDPELTDVVLENQDLLYRLVKRH